MSIQEGDTLPSQPIKVVHDGTMNDTTTDALFGSGRHVIFGLPGAFTPTCSAKHLPGFVERLDELKSRGVASVACLSVNDAFVMKAWAEANGSPDIVMLADGNADLTEALGLAMDGRAFSMGTRCQRFAMIVDDGRVTKLMVEKPGDFSVSSAESVLTAL